MRNEDAALTREARCVQVRNSAGSCTSTYPMDNVNAKAAMRTRVGSWDRGAVIVWLRRSLGSARVPAGISGRHQAHGRRGSRRGIASSRCAKPPRHHPRAEGTLHRAMCAHGGWPVLGEAPSGRQVCISLSRTRGAWTTARRQTSLSAERPTVAPRPESSTPTTPRTDSAMTPARSGSGWPTRSETIRGEKAY